MNKIISGSLFMILLVGLSAFTWTNESTTIEPEHTTATINWLTWEEAVALNKTQPKKIFVDVYTEWCGWCKKMDKSTFKDPVIADYMNKHFYAVKLDAEQKADINFNGHTFKFVRPKSGRGMHALAYSLLDGKMSFPSFVLLDQKYNRIMMAPGFQQVEDLEAKLSYAAGEHYLNQQWQTYYNAWYKKRHTKIKK